ncbi:MAG TPA: hypothetical protein VKG43_09385 [Acidimicrobiales bacterium]|nr:hypothetical protein [Acidimicrobiales bacterium]
MDIEEFYDADPRRRRSAEVELGTEWTDKHGLRYEVVWVEDTGELYTMREPAGPQYEDPFGGIHVDIKSDAEVPGMTVGVVAEIATRDELDRILDGWEAAEPEPDSTAWLIERLHQTGVSTFSENAPD